MPTKIAGKKAPGPGEFLKPILGDHAGKPPFNTVFGEQVVATKLTTVMTNAVYGKGPMKILETVTNGGTVTTANSLLVVTSSTATNGSANVESQRSVRYRPGEEFYAYFTVLFTPGTAGSTQFCGPLSSTDGFAIGFNNEDFIICRRTGSGNVIVTQDNFNRDKMDGTGQSGYTIDPTMLNLYRITFGWLGSANIFFEHFTSDRGWIIYHEIEVAGTLSIPHIGVPYLPMTLEVVKTSGSTSIITKSGSWNAGVMGQPTTGISDKLHATESGIVTLSGGVQTPILTLRGLATMDGVINRIEAVLLHISVVSEGTKPVVYRLFKNPTIDSGDFTNHETDVSVLEISLNAAITGGDLELGTATAKSGSTDLDVEHLRLNLHKAESYVLTAESANAADVCSIITWREEL